MTEHNEYSRNGYIPNQGTPQNVNRRSMPQTNINSISQQYPPQGYSGNQQQYPPQGYIGNQRQNAPQGYSGNQQQYPPQGYNGNQRQNAPQGYNGNQQQYPPQGYSGNQRQNAPQGYNGNQQQYPPQGYSGNQRQNAPQGYNGNQQQYPPQGNIGNQQQNPPQTQNVNRQYSQSYTQTRPQNSGEIPPQNPKGGFKLTGRTILIGVCGIVFIVCAVMLISYAIEAAKVKKLNSLASDITFSDNDFTEATQIPEITPVPTPVPTMAAVAVPILTDENALQSTPEPTPINGNPWPKTYPKNATLRINNNFYSLRSTYNNNDICAYLEIEGVIDGQPVTQRDNSYYLTHSVDLQSNQNGTLFIDENCDLKTVPAQIIVYGHNMKDGLAFGPLKKYATKDSAFYKQHPFITLNTLYENGRYVIFAVIDDLDIRSGQPKYLPFWYYSNFSSVDEFNNYIIQAKALSKYHCTIDVDPGDRLLVLSTCVGTNEYQKNLRFIIMARMIRENETEFELEQKIMTVYER